MCRIVAQAQKAGLSGRGAARARGELELSSRGREEDVLEPHQPVDQGLQPGRRLGLEAQAPPAAADLAAVGDQVRRLAERGERRQRQHQSGPGDLGRPATVLQAGPCVITQHKTQTRDGYESAQIGLVEFVKEKKLTKAMRGHFGKHNLPPVRFVREVGIEVDAPGETTEGVIKPGDRILVDIFENERFVDVIGVSKGHGFQGVVKRHHFGGGPKSHGSMFQITGSIGSSAFPSRVFKGMRMSGHMGNQKVTTRNLRVLGVDKDENLLVVEGSVPGPQGGYIVIMKAKKPPRERRGFAGSATVDPLKAAKRAAKKA